MLWSLSLVGMMSCSILYQVSFMCASTGVVCKLCHTCVQFTFTHFVLTRRGLPLGVSCMSSRNVSYTRLLYARCGSLNVTGNSAQHCQNVGISGWGGVSPPPPDTPLATTPASYCSQADADLYSSIGCDSFT
jgi:hypothetical protein